MKRKKPAPVRIRVIGDPMPTATIEPPFMKEAYIGLVVTAFDTIPPAPDLYPFPQGFYFVRLDEVGRALLLSGKHRAYQYFTAHWGDIAGVCGGESILLPFPLDSCEVVH